MGRIRRPSQSETKPPSDRLLLVLEWNQHHEGTCWGRPAPPSSPSSSEEGTSSAQREQQRLLLFQSLKKEQALISFKQKSCVL